MTRHLIYKIITIWFLISQLFPPYYYFVPMGGALCLAIFVGLTMVMFPSLITKKSFIALLIYGLIIFAKFISGNAFFPVFDSVIVPWLSMAAGMLMALYAFKYGNRNYYKLVTITSIILLVIISIITIPMLAINPNIVRYFTLSAKDISIDSTLAFSYWIIGYGTVHGLPIIIAPLVFMCKKTFRINKKKCALWVIATVVILYIVTQSNATTSFIVAAAVAFLALIINFQNLTTKNCLKLCFIAIITSTLFSKPVISPAIDIAQEMFPENSSNYIKLNELKYYFINGTSEGDLGSREALYKQSRLIFFESPVMGTNTPEKISRHTFFWDMLALLGIILVIPLILAIWYNLKDSYSLLSRTKVIYIIGWLAFFMMIYLKNEFGSGTWLFAFALLPIYCKYIDNYLENSLL